MNDILITFEPGDCAGYAKGLTPAGSNFLSDNRRVMARLDRQWFVETKDLLPLLERGMERNLRIQWNKP
jgi:hypothetical protein